MIFTSHFRPCHCTWYYVTRGNNIYHSFQNIIKLYTYFSYSVSRVTKYLPMSTRCCFHTFKNFWSLLRKDLLYTLKNQPLCKNQSRFLVVDNQMKIGFSNNTQVEHCTDFEGPMNAFNFADFNSIFSHSLQPNLSIG